MKRRKTRKKLRRRQKLKRDMVEDPKANDVLSDELKKKEYDQTLPFDDDIPR